MIQVGSMQVQGKKYNRKGHYLDKPKLSLTEKTIYVAINIWNNSVLRQNWESVELECSKILSCIWFSSVQFSSVAQSWPTLCKPMNPSMPGLPVHHRNTTNYWTMSKLRYITSRVNTVLVSQDCHNKLPQTGCLKTTEIYSLRVLGVRGPK